MDELAEEPGVVTEGWLTTATNDEALARLEFVIHKPNSVGLLVGPRGSGKSLLLARTAAQRRRVGEPIALLDATALPPTEALHRLALAWHNPVAIDASPARHWQAVTEALVMHRCEQRSSVALVDNAGDASFELLDLLARLVHAGDIWQSSLVLVLATEATRLSHLGTDLLSRVNLRIDLAPLDLEETRRYLAQQFARDTTAVLDDGAVTRLHQLTAGLPRRLNQLAELVMLAAKAEGHATIAASTVDAVYRELSVQALTRR